MFGCKWEKQSQGLLTWLTVIFVVLPMPLAVMAEDVDVDDASWEDSEAWGGDDSFGSTSIDLTNIQYEKPKWYTLGGYIREDIGYSWQDNDPSLAFSRKDAGFSKVRTTLYLYADMSLGETWKAKASANMFYDAAYSFDGRDNFSDKTLSSFEDEVELRDTYIEGQIFGPIWLKLGKQIVAWGASDGSTIIDLVNPTDNREFGQMELEDLRIPVWATKVYFTKADWGFSAVAVHEIRPNRDATEGAEFDPFIGYRNTPVVISDYDVPSDSFENTEYLVQVKKNFVGGDLAFMYGDVIDNEPYLERSVDGSSVVLTPSFKRINVFGVSGNYVVGSYLYKSDIAYKNNRRLMRSQFLDELAAPPVTGLGEAYIQKDVIDSMVGVEYVGIHDLTITFELTASHIKDYEAVPFTKMNSVSSYLNLRYNMLNETAQVSFTWNHLSHNNGNIYRTSIEYDLYDEIEVSASLIFYDAKDNSGSLYSYRRNDRLTLGVKYSF